MKNTISNLGRVLARTEQKQINGGGLQLGSGSCAYYNGETGYVSYNLSSNEAQIMLSNGSDHWCCNNCGSASWYDHNEADDRPQ
jgi:hypothetical protein